MPPTGRLKIIPTNQAKRCQSLSSSSPRTAKNRVAEPVMKSPVLDNYPETQTSLDLPDDATKRHTPEPEENFDDATGNSHIDDEIWRKG